MLQLYRVRLLNDIFFEVDITFGYIVVHFFERYTHIHSKGLLPLVSDLPKVVSRLVQFSVSITVIYSLSGEIPTHFLIGIIAINISFLLSEATTYIFILTARSDLIC